MDQLEEMTRLILGDGADELISKMNPDSSDIHINQAEKKKRKITAGLSAVGAAAGAAGLALGGHNLSRSYKYARYGVKGNKAARKAAGAVKPVKAKGASVKSAVGNEKLATGLIPLEVAGLGGELMATKILHGDAKEPKKKKIVVKSYDPQKLPKSPTEAQLKAFYVADVKTRQHGPKVVNKGKLVAKTSAAKAKKAAVAVKEKVYKADVVFTGELSKMDTDKRQVFGWASVTEVDGEPVHDRQGDYIALDEIEKSAYHYVNHSRKGGDMHQRDGEVPLQKSDMIESFVVTPEKLEKLGLPRDSMPHGWWVGYQVRDEDLWQKVKSGERVGFSIHGKGVRTPMED